jgi:hypothetical protein
VPERTNLKRKRRKIFPGNIPEYSGSPRTLVDASSFSDLETVAILEKNSWERREAKENKRLQSNGRGEGGNEWAKKKKHWPPLDSEDEGVGAPKRDTVHSKISLGETSVSVSLGRV